MSNSQIEKSSHADKGLSLRVKLLLPIVVILLCTISLAASFAARTAKQALIEAANEKTRYVAYNVANNMMEQINRARADIAMAGVVPEVAAVLDPESSLHFASRTEFLDNTNRLLKKMADVSGYYESFYVTSDKGMTLSSSLFSQVQVLDISNRDWFQLILNSSSVLVTDPLLSRLSGDALVIVGSSLQYGPHRGTIIGGLQLYKIAPKVLRHDSAMHQTMIVTSGGMIVAHEDKSKITNLLDTEDGWLGRMLDDEDGLLEVTRNGRTELLAFYNLPDTDLYAVASADKQEILRPARWVSFACYGVGFGAVILAAILIFLVLKPVTRDIRRLADYARRIGMGELDRQVRLDRRDELGEMSQSFDLMIDKLKQMIATAEEATQAKSDFLARMSHEIRTPMNAITGMAYLGQQVDPESLQTSYFEKIQAASASLLGIINDILDFSKIEAGKMELENADFFVGDIIQSLRDMLVFRAREKGIDLEFYLDDGVPGCLVGDTLRLAQICINLISNGMKFTDTGRVTMHIRPVQDLGDEVILQFSVADTGIGMSEDQLDRVFEPFSQADGSTTRRFGGTGLGLAICKQLVGLMGGEIWVESILGKGSTFHFTGRFKKGDGSRLNRRGRNERNMPRPKFKNVKVLLVEDNELNQEIACELLREMDIEPIVANNGAESIVVFGEQGPFDMVLMDIQMPIMDGLEATRRIRGSSFEGGSEVPILAMTANAMQGDMERSLAAGMTDYLSKPIDPYDLQRAMREWLPKDSLVEEEADGGE